MCAMVKTPYVGDGHLTFNRNPYNGYINPYYWVDDHPLLYGNVMGVDRPWHMWFWVQKQTKKRDDNISRGQASMPGEPPQCPCFDRYSSHIHTLEVQDH